MGARQYLELEEVGAIGGSEGPQDGAADKPGGEAAHNFITDIPPSDLDLELASSAAVPDAAPESEPSDVPGMLLVAGSAACFSAMSLLVTLAERTGLPSSEVVLVNVLLRLLLVWPMLLRRRLAPFPKGTRCRLSQTDSHFRHRSTPHF